VKRSYIYLINKPNNNNDEEALRKEKSQKNTAVGEAILNQSYSI